MTAMTLYLLFLSPALVMIAGAVPVLLVARTIARAS
jgi:hypothetical protein